MSHDDNTMIEQWYSQDKTRAVDAKFEAQRLAFAPIAFQAAKSLRDSGILQLVFDAGDTGLERGQITSSLKINDYAVGVLLEMGLSMNLLKIVPGITPWKFLLGKTGYFILTDPMTRANMDFVNDVCYKGGFWLAESLAKGKPLGLKVFGDWPTIYQGLSSLPASVQKSWFAFDHYYSDVAFPDALKVVFARPRKHIMDIGGNTAKWALGCFKHDPDVRVTIVDLPGQTGMARKNIEDTGAGDRISTHEADMLDPSSQLPRGADAVWMSQFLDCFSLEQVTDILAKVERAVDNKCDVFVMEPLWDRQKYPAATYSLHATSLYFTTMANGNSKMYSTEELVLAINRAGFHLTEEHHRLGPNDYSILCFRRNP